MSSDYLEAAVETAQEAGRILLEEFDRPARISYKGEADLVTQADRRSEEAIVARLKKYFPGHAILAEEGSGHEKRSQFRWYVDPLDGTTNFAHGYPCFAVSIALAEGDAVVAGVVYNPVSEETFTAARGEGATLDGRKIRVSAIGRLATSLLATGFPSHSISYVGSCQHSGKRSCHLESHEKGPAQMLPQARPRRLLPVLLMALALFFVVRDPAKAADVTTKAFNGLLAVIDALATFASGLG